MSLSWSPPSPPSPPSPRWKADAFWCLSQLLAEAQATFGRAFWTKGWNIVFFVRWVEKNPQTPVNNSGQGWSWHYNTVIFRYAIICRNVHETVSPKKWRNETERLKLNSFTGDSSWGRCLGCTGTGITGDGWMCTWSKFPGPFKGPLSLRHRHFMVGYFGRNPIFLHGHFCYGSLEEQRFKKQLQPTKQNRHCYLPIVQHVAQLMWYNLYTYYFNFFGRCHAITGMVVFDHLWTLFGLVPVESMFGWKKSRCRKNTSSRQARRLHEFHRAFDPPAGMP